MNVFITFLVLSLSELLSVRFQVSSDTPPDFPLCRDLDKVEDTPFIIMILLVSSGRLLCMGSIINEHHVLSAKSCFEKTDSASLMVLAGYLSPYWGANSQVKFVSRIKKHAVQDLAVLVLAKPFLFSPTVKAIRIIGPEVEDDNYSEDRPWMVAGFRLPKTVLQGTLIPQGYIYHFLKEGPLLYVDDDCKEMFLKANTSTPPLNAAFHFCSPGGTEFCWTAIGSPTVVVLDNIPFQIAVVTFAHCKPLPPTPRPPTKPPGDDGEEDEDEDKKKPMEHSPYVHLRLDLFWGWIEANAYIKRQ